MLCLFGKFVRGGGKLNCTVGSKMAPGDVVVVVLIVLTGRIIRRCPFGDLLSLCLSPATMYYGVYDATVLYLSAPYGGRGGGERSGSDEKTRTNKLPPLLSASLPHFVFRRQRRRRRRRRLHIWAGEPDKRGLVAD